VLALVLDRLLARPDLADDLDVLAGLHERLAVRLAVPSFDDLRPRDAEPEQEAAARELIQRRRRHRGHRGRARRHLHDAARDVDLLRARGDPRERRDGVRAVRLGRPHRVEAESIGLLDERHVERHLAAGVSDGEAKRMVRSPLVERSRW
jgi:hypothetical protein